MKIGIIDNDLNHYQKYSFPNLALMKISAHHKKNGDKVKLTSFDNISNDNLFREIYDIVYIGKVFTESQTPKWVLNLSNVKYGGTGFYLDKAVFLPNEIEHTMPDYELYDIKKCDNKYYTDSSIGFTTRGCFRHCEFCVNKHSDKVLIHSPLKEFYNPSKNYITLLDDNVLGLKNSELYPLLDELIETGKRVQFRQGMDIRLLTKERAIKLIKMRYDSHYHFAFDRMVDSQIIESKLKLWQETWDSIYSGTAYYINTRFYIFMGLDKNDIYDDDFWIGEIESVFKRIKILFKYKSIPFVMRYYKWKESIFYSFLIELTQWSNSALNVTQYSFNEYIDISNRKKSKIFRDKYPKFKIYFDLKLKP